MSPSASTPTATSMSRSRWRWTSSVDDWAAPASQPDVDVGDLDGRLVADGELVVASGEAAVLFVPVDAALDGVPLSIGGRVERRGTAAGRSSFAAGGLLVGLDRDGCRDAAPSQVAPVAAAGVGLVGQHPVRAAAWTPWATPARYPDAAEHGGELWAVGGLAGGHHRGQGLAPLLDRQVHLR